MCEIFDWSIPNCPAASDCTAARVTRCVGIFPKGGFEAAVASAQGRVTASGKNNVGGLQIDPDQREDRGLAGTTVFNDRHDAVVGVGGAIEE